VHPVSKEVCERKSSKLGEEEARHGSFGWKEGGKSGFPQEGGDVLVSMGMLGTRENDGDEK
jgi:hypothetical protein